VQSVAAGAELLALCPKFLELLHGPGMLRRQRPGLPALALRLGRAAYGGPFRRLLGLPGDTTLSDVAAQIDAIDGLKATVDASGRLTLATDAPTVEFAFANDTAGLGAALGIGTFFTGTGASDVGVAAELAKDPRLLATSGRGVGNDSDVVTKLAGLLDKPLAGHGGRSLAEVYEKLVADTVQTSSNVSAAAEGFRTFRDTLESQKLAQSGVNLDEEAVRMIAFQYAFQASARLITTVRELLDTLIAL